MTVSVYTPCGNRHEPSLQSPPRQQPVRACKSLRSPFSAASLKKQPFPGNRIRRQPGPAFRTAPVRHPDAAKCAPKFGFTGYPHRPGFFAESGISAVTASRPPPCAAEAEVRSPQHSRTEAGVCHLRRRLPFPPTISISRKSCIKDTASAAT